MGWKSTFTGGSLCSIGDLCKQPVCHPWQGKHHDLVSSIYSFFSAKIQMEKSFFIDTSWAHRPPLAAMCLPRPSPSAIDWVFRVLSHSVYYSSSGCKAWLDTQTKLSLKLPLSLPVIWKQPKPEPSVISWRSCCLWVRCLCVVGETQVTNKGMKVKCCIKRKHANIKTFSFNVKIQVKLTYKMWKI